MFSPHHRMEECHKFTEIIKSIKATINPSDLIIEDTIRYYDSLVHKLKSANKNREAFSDLITNAKPENIDESFLFNANHYADGFFYCCGSAIDILARLVLLVFGDPLSGDVYFAEAKRKIAISHPGNNIIPKLDSPGWKPKFSEYRNALTHEILVVDIVNTTMKFSNISGKEFKVVIPFPDDPRKRPTERTYEGIRDGNDYMRKTFKSFLSFINIIFKELNNQLKATSSYPL
jgi:hypothetical protein